MKHCSLEEIVCMHKSLKSNLLATLCVCCGVWLNLRQDLRSLNGSEVCKGLGSENPTCLVGKRRVKGSTALEDFHERLFYAHTNLFDFTGVPM